MDGHLVGRDQITSAVEAIKKYLNKTGEHQKNLLNPVEQEDIHLQFAMKKVSLKKKLLRILLPHSLVDETTSVCLFVRDEDRANRDYSVTVDAIKEKLKSAGVTQSIEIVPLKQLKLEYKEYESKRSLLTLYDTFLADERIVRLLPPQLGKHFYVRRRHPVQVDITRDQSLKKEIDRALSTTQCLFAGRGSSGQVTIARMSQSMQEVVDNVVAAIQRLSTSVAGGVMNIRSLHLKAQDSLSLPIYISTGSKDDVKFEPSNRKRTRVEPEEVTTITEGKVLVTKRGSVRVFSTNGSEVRSATRKPKKISKTPLKPTSPSPKRKNIPLLVPALMDVEQPTPEIKEEIDDAESLRLEKSKKTSNAAKQKIRKVETKKVGNKENNQAKVKPSKAAVVIDLKVEEVKEEEELKNTVKKSSSKVVKSKKSGKDADQKILKRKLDSEPAKKKRKV